MGTKLFALLTDGKDVERLAGALLDAVSWHLLCYGEKLEFSAAGNPRFPFELLMRFTASHPETGVRLVYPVSALEIGYFWTRQLDNYAKRASQLLPIIKVANVTYISTTNYGKVTVYKGGRLLEVSWDKDEYISDFCRVLRKHFGVSWNGLEDWHHGAYVYSNFGLYAREKRLLTPVFEDEAEAVEAYRAGRTKNDWPFKTPWKWAKNQSAEWEKADSGRYDSRMFALVDGYPSLEILPVPKELTPEEWFRYEAVVEQKIKEIESARR